MMSQVERFFKLNRELIQAFSQTDRPEYAEARLLGNLQAILPVFLDDKNIAQVNDLLDASLKRELIKILSQEVA
jgi:hypothetical protein